MKVKHQQKSIRCLYPSNNIKALVEPNFQKKLNKHLLNNVQLQVTLTSQKLGTQFNFEDTTKFEHKNDAIFWKMPRTELY